MNPVIGVGAPWYTSGIHEWNGTAPTLNNSPTDNSATPISAIEWLLPAASDLAMPGSDSVSVAP